MTYYLSALLCEHLQGVLNICRLVDDFLGCFHPEARYDSASKGHPDGFGRGDQIGFLSTKLDESLFT